MRKPTGTFKRNTGRRITSAVIYFILICISFV